MELTRNEHVDPSLDALYSTYCSCRLLNELLGYDQDFTMMPFRYRSTVNVRFMRVPLFSLHKHRNNIVARYVFLSPSTFASSDQGSPVSLFVSVRLSAALQHRLIRDVRFILKYVDSCLAESIICIHVF